VPGSESWQASVRSPTSQATFVVENRVLTSSIILTRLNCLVKRRNKLKACQRSTVARIATTAPSRRRLAAAAADRDTRPDNQSALLARQFMDEDVFVQLRERGSPYGARFP
jgi:hypothetical protein